MIRDVHLTLAVLNGKNVNLIKSQLNNSQIIKRLAHRRAFEIRSIRNCFSFTPVNHSQRNAQLEAGKVTCGNIFFPRNSKPTVRLKLENLQLQKESTKRGILAVLNFSDHVISGILRKSDKGRKRFRCREKLHVAMQGPGRFPTCSHLIATRGKIEFHDDAKLKLHFLALQTDNHQT